MEKSKTARDAVAEAWASIDWKLEAYKLGEKDGIDAQGHYVGYQVEAGELLTRVAMRGYTIRPHVIDIAGSANEEKG